ncbi:MAG: phosphoribosylanthranilate isomerase [Elusimicrobia bacterium]|nr:phosphoribosylanthranilate isomerase [Elusimicrobiota bacterium]MBI2916098.1 phosphoribosylanthranilate isomerase [Elusimicrobiota bacterium]
MKSKKILVKICGITNSEDALWAANLGADYVGLNFCESSKRKVSAEKAKEIALGLPPFVKSVGVFLNPDLDSLKKILKVAPLSVLQLHGSESPELLQQIKSEFQIPLWKAIRVENQESLNTIASYTGLADILLMDSFNENDAGGTGQLCDWDLAAQSKSCGIPIFLAGGLTAANVEEAIEKVDPAGVDVASGVEKKDHPRRKDLDQMKLFIQRSKWS